MDYMVALVEDNKINRGTFIQKLGDYAGLQLLFTAEDGNGFLEQLQELPASKLPQVVFMDLEMPGMDGVTAIRIGKYLFPQVHFIVLTIFDDDEKIFEAIRAGASGYLLKHEPASEIWEAVIDVMELGGAPMSPSIARKALKLLSKLPEYSGTAEIETSLPVSITEREKQVLQFMVNGWDAKRIAATLQISVLTARKHIANIYEKLHVQSRAQVISLAHRNKWLD